MTEKQRHPSSFRDPSGYIFKDEGQVKRAILPIYFLQYQKLKDSNFLEKLIKAGLLIPHKELSSSQDIITIEPEQLPFISYPYEWSFLQYKEAALLTLKIQKFAIEQGFSLKDASAFNVALYKGRMIFIDTLSFEDYNENEPWRAYKQFVMHFLGPLVLAHYHGAQSLKLMHSFLEGIPLSMLASMLPFKSKLSPFLYTNIHLLAKFEAKHHLNQSETKASTASLSKKAQLNILKSLYGYIKKLELSDSSEWADYYNKTNYDERSSNHKAEILDSWVRELPIKTLIDVGGNDGTYVRKLSSQLDLAVVADIDVNSVDQNYLKVRGQKDTYMHPMVLDILNPTSGIGFGNTERDAFLDRIKNLNPDCTLALALIHHMTLSGNVPFEMSAKLFASFSNYLVIEFPKPQDSMVQRLLDTKGHFKDHFNFYSLENFKAAYKRYFHCIDEKEILNSQRVLFLYKRNGHEI